MNWRTDEPPKQVECCIRTADGQEFVGKLIHLNPQFHRHAECLDVWSIRGHKSVAKDKVVEWRYAIDI